CFAPCTPWNLRSIIYMFSLERDVNARASVMQGDGKCLQRKKFYKYHLSRDGASTDPTPKDLFVDGQKKKDASGNVIRERPRRADVIAVLSRVQPHLNALR
ncbi:hypothetical protein PFISCL1PPCAC_16466, partial [Pristionchus fissidentatus]